MKTFTFALMICSGLVTSGYSADKNFDITTYPAKDIIGVNVRTVSGDIYIDTQKRMDIQVEQFADNKTACDVTIQVVENNLVLKAIEKDGIHGRIKTGFKVHLPATLPILAETTSGNIKINDLASPVKAKSVSGDIKLAKIAAPVDAETTSGNIKLTDVAAPINTKSTSGNVSVTFPKNAQIAVDATTSSGKIRNDFVGKGGMPVIAKTISGNIHIVKGN